MSNEVNTKLFERASEMIDYWSGTLHAKLIEGALDSNDLEALRGHVNKAEQAMYDIEYRPDLEPVTDEQIEALGRRAWTGEMPDAF